MAGFSMPGFDNNDFLAKLGFGKQKSDKKGSRALKEGLAQFEGLNLPTFERYSPNQAAYEEVGPSALEGVGVNQGYRKVQEDQLAALRNIAERGGRSAAGDAELARIQSQGSSRARGARDAIMQRANARGMGGSGAALVAQLTASQNATNQANQQGLQIAGQNQQNELAARLGAAGVGSNLEGNDYQRAANKAKAADAIRRFNASNKMDTSRHNTGLQNQGQMYNNQLQQNAFDNDYRKRGGIANQNQGLANFYQGQSKIGAQQAGNIMGGAIKAGAAAYGVPPAPESGNGAEYDDENNQYYAADGLEVPGEPLVEGDSEVNDIVPIMASPGEVVVPRSVRGSSPQDIVNFVQNPPQAGQDRDQAMRSFLEREYSDSKANHQRSKADSRRAYLAGNLGHAAEQIATSNSVAHGGAPVDGAYYARIAKRPVEAVDTKPRDLMIKDYMLDKLGARSQTSARERLASAEKIASEGNASREKIGRERNEAKATAKGTLGYNPQRAKALMDVHQRMVSPRGNTAVQRAMQDARAGAKIQALFKKYEGNLDKMPAVDVNLASQEIAALAGGGHGSDTSRAAVTAKTLASDFNEFMGYVGGKPTASQLGEFLKAKKHYVDELKKIADEDVKKYQGDVFNQVKQLNPTDDELAPFAETFPHLFPAPRESYVEDTAGNPSMTIQAPQATAPQAPASDPQDEAALNWLMDNPEDPRAAGISAKLQAKGLLP